jgi:hypothetical protein
VLSLKELKRVFALGREEESTAVAQCPLALLLSCFKGVDGDCPSLEVDSPR